MKDKLYVYIKNTIKVYFDMCDFLMFGPNKRISTDRKIKKEENRCPPPVSATILLNIINREASWNPFHNLTHANVNLISGLQHCWNNY